MRHARLTESSEYEARRDELGRAEIELTPDGRGDRYASLDYGV